MAASALKTASSKELRRLLALLGSSASEALGSLIARELLVRTGDLLLLTAADLLATIARPCVVVRGALDKDYAGKMLLTLIEAQDATAMAGHLMLTPDDVIEQRRAKQTLEGEDLEAFAELANVLCSGIGNILRDNVANCDLRLLDHGPIKPGLDEKNLLPAEKLVACKLTLKVGAHPESQAMMILDLATAEKWNKGPLETGGTLTDTVATAVAIKTEEDSLEEIPAATVQGVLNGYLVNQEPWRLLRRSCRRVGFELRRFSRGEIPNPAAHKDEVVLLDVPLGEEKRFDWCKRIKDYGGNVKVVLILHRPSRARVTQAFLSQADLIIGWPIDEAQLSVKLAGILAAKAEAKPEVPGN
jgi:hypothetical protein